MTTILIWSHFDWTANYCTVEIKTLGLPVDHLQYTTNGVRSLDEVTLKDQLYYYASVLLKTRAPILSAHNRMKVLPV